MLGQSCESAVRLLSVWLYQSNSGTFNELFGLLFVPLVYRLDLQALIPQQRTDICTAQSRMGLLSLSVWHSVGSERKSLATPAMVLSVS